MSHDEQVTMSDGSPIADDHGEINPATGQESDYVVLSAEEGAKGFVRPVRLAYVHVGAPAPKNLRDLTDGERERYDAYGYVKFEPYGEDRSPLTGRYWTQAQLDHSATPGCGTVTTMARPIAETYAREPSFYRRTFCCGCRKHLPVGRVRRVRVGRHRRARLPEQEANG